jgi:hypothetical protein
VRAQHVAGVLAASGLFFEKKWNFQGYILFWCLNFGVCIVALEAGFPIAIYDGWLEILPWFRWVGVLFKSSHILKKTNMVEGYRWRGLGGWGSRTTFHVAVLSCSRVRCVGVD